MEIDSKIIYFVSQHRTNLLTEFFYIVTQAGKGVTILAISVIMVISITIKRKYLYVLPFVLTVVGAGITVRTMKYLINRSRPEIDVSYYLERGLSFPSSHAAMSFVLYGFIAYFLVSSISSSRNTMRILIPIITLIVLIGASRVYLGVHYVTDVVGGYLLGGLWLIVGIISIKLFPKIFP